MAACLSCFFLIMLKERWIFSQYIIFVYWRVGFSFFTICTLSSPLFFHLVLKIRQKFISCFFLYHFELLFFFLEIEDLSTNDQIKEHSGDILSLKMSYLPLTLAAWSGRCVPTLNLSAFTEQECVPFNTRDGRFHKDCQVERTLHL